MRPLRRLSALLLLVGVGWGVSNLPRRAAFEALLGFLLLVGVGVWNLPRHAASETLLGAAAAGGGGGTPITSRTVQCVR